MLPLPLVGQEWLPAAVRASLIREVEAKLGAIDTDGKLSPERIHEAAQVSVDGVAARLDVLGAERVMAMAPSFPELGMPAGGTEAVEALAAYQICSLPMDLTYANDTPRPNRYDERAWALFLAVSIYVVSGFLRPQYLAEGIGDEEAQALLEGEEMRAIKARVRTDGDLLRLVRDRCADPLLEIMQ